MFDGGEMDVCVAEEIVLPADELSDWRFHDADDLETALIARLARRVIAALEARQKTCTTYLEHGTHPVD